VLNRALLRRGDLVLAADPKRVIAKLFLPGQETLASGLSRADAVLNRVLDMPDEVVAATLAETLELFGDRHRDLRDILATHYKLVSHRLRDRDDISPDRALLIGAYFTQEFSVEAAALLNPSMVAHPDQSGLEAGQVRFIASVRAVGEGHVSSIEFRTGVAGDGDQVVVADPGRQVTAGRTGPRLIAREYLTAALAEESVLARAGDVLELLPDLFSAADLDRAVDSVRHDRLTRGSAEAAIDKIRWLVSCNYRAEFPADRPLSERVLYPAAPDEGRGMEDARLTRFVEEDGRVTYYGTYTAFDGVNIRPHLLQTDDFVSFETTHLIGPAARNKGMAIFPRRVGGEFLALSRWDRESIGITSSADGRYWAGAVTVQTPERTWEVIQIGNCGPPVETDEGWLVLTHGVGAMRAYGIGAILLDLDEPTKLIGALRQPLLMPNAAEREGYVPNVVYSCGGLMHGDTLVVPYGCSDSSIRFAFVDVPTLLERLRTDGP